MRPHEPWPRTQHLTLLALLVAALWGCSDQSTNLLSPQDVLYSLSDPECPRDIEEETGEAATNCKYRGAGYERARSEVHSYVTFHHQTCIDAWQRAKELMDRDNVFSYDHTWAGYWEGTQSVTDRIWVHNFYWDMDVYRSNFYETLLHEAAHSLYGKLHGVWKEEIEGCIEA